VPGALGAGGEPSQPSAPAGAVPASSSPPGPTPSGLAHTQSAAPEAGPPQRGTRGTLDTVGGRRQTSAGRRLLPEATVRRLPLYLRALADEGDGRRATISSDELAAKAGVNAAQVRKDLSYLGSYGTRGIGYDMGSLRQHLGRELGLNREYNVALVGVGNLGRALGNYRGFAERGFHVVAAFDSDPAKVGEQVGSTVVYPLSELRAVVRERGISMALVATPAAAAQDVVDRLVDAGVTSVLNFAPVVLSVGPGVSVRRVDLAVELQILSYYESTRRQPTL
jgi:redox-sensing transcriptional repressor